MKKNYCKDKKFQNFLCTRCKKFSKSIEQAKISWFRAGLGNFFALTGHFRRLKVGAWSVCFCLLLLCLCCYGLETVAVTKKQVEEMEVAEMKMLRFAMGVTRKDKIRNEHIRSTVKVERLGMKMRESRLRWYGHVMRRDQEYVGRKMMEMELPGKRRRGRPKRRFLDVVKEDMKEVGVKEMDIEDRKMWRMMIRCGHP